VCVCVCVVCVCVCVCVCTSDLSNNRLQHVGGLTFQGLSNVITLRLRRNLLTDLMDGAFYGLTSIENMYVCAFSCRDSWLRSYKS